MSTPTIPISSLTPFSEVVAKSRYDADVAELNERLTRQQADMLDTIVQLRAELTTWQSEAARYSAEREHNANMAGMWQSMAGRLATAAQGYNTTEIEYREWQHGMRDALAAYESVKSGNLPDPLAEAVKRMEAVTTDDLCLKFKSSSTLGEMAEQVRARLIAAAKGEQP